MIFEPPIFNYIIAIGLLVSIYSWLWTATEGVWVASVVSLMPLVFLAISSYIERGC